METRSIKKGFLNKKGRGQIFRPWTLRQVILDYNQCKLSYFDGNTLKGEVNLERANIRQLLPTEADGRPHAFEIYNIHDTDVLKSNSLILAAGSELEALEWINAINNVLQIVQITHHPTEHVYESFETLEAQLQPEPIHDAAYYKNLRAKNQEEKQKKLQTQSNLPSSSIITSTEESGDTNVITNTNNNHKTESEMVS